jgi:hypothetical protein
MFIAAACTTAMMPAQLGYLRLTGVGVWRVPDGTPSNCRHYYQNLAPQVLWNFAHKLVLEIWR